MFGINQISQTVGQTVPLLAEQQDQYIAKKDAETQATKSLWLGVFGGALMGFGLGFAAAKQGWL